MTPAKLYIRRNGQYGSSCDGVMDTGHHIVAERDRFTVYSAHDPDVVIVKNATRDEAEKAIEQDWRAAE